MDIEARKEHQWHIPGKMAGPDWYAWALYGLALLHFVLLFTVENIRDPNAFAIYWLYPAGIVGAGVLTVYGALIQPLPKHRWAWMLQAGSCLCGALRSALGLWYAQQGSMLPQTSSVLFYIGMYVGSLGAVALYLPRHAWWLGNALRVLIDSATVGVSVFILLSGILSLLLPNWQPTQAPPLFVIGMNAAMLFSVYAVSVRYRGGGGPLLTFALLSIICLLLGDAIPVIARLIPGVPVWGSLFNPLYMLHYALLAVGIYRSAAQPPRAQAVEQTQMPHVQWLLWAIVPEIALLCAFTLAYVTQPVPFWMLLALFCFSIAHMVFLIGDVRDVLRQVQQSNRALSAAQQETEQANAQLARADHEKAVLLERRQIAAAEIAHDVGAAVQDVRLAVDALRRVLPPNGSHEEQLTAAEASTEFIGDLLVALVAAAQLDAGALQLNLQPASVEQVVARVVRQQVPSANAAGVRVLLDLASGLPPVWCDPRLIQRALANIVSNAIKYTGAARSGTGLVFLSAERLDDHIQITITDNGPGIAPDDLTRVRQQFARGTGVGAPAGFGLGLSFAYGVIEQHPGGALRIESEPDAGTSVLITLAIAGAPPQETAV